MKHKIQLQLYQAYLNKDGMMKYKDDHSLLS